MDTTSIIEKWYKRIGFDSRYDPAFYDALRTIPVDPAATVDTYDCDCPDGKKNFLHFLYFCEALSEKYQKKGIPEDVLLDTLSDLPRWLDTWSELKGELHLGELHWLRLHLRGHLFQLGRLQFCMAPALKGLESLGIRQGDPVLEVHIPSIGPLTPEDCDDAIARAKDFFATYFPQYSYKYFTCDSWLLDPTLSRVLKPSSNILLFQKRFRIAATHPSDSLLGYIFPWKTKREDLPGIIPTSPLAAKVKDLILQGETFYLALGAFEK